MIKIPALQPDNPAAYLATLGLVRILSPVCEISIAWSGPCANDFAVVYCDKADTVEELAALLRKNHDSSWLPAGKDIRSFDSSPASWIGRDDAKTSKGMVIPTYWRFDGIKVRTGWLDNIRKLFNEVKGEENYLEAFTEWNQTNIASPLGFDPTAWQDSSKQKQDASSTGQLCTAGLIWLAVNAIPLFPVFTSGTTGIENDTFRYPTWKHPLGLASIEAICHGYRGRQDLGIVPGGSTAWESEVQIKNDRKQWMFATPSSGMLSLVNRPGK